MTTFVLQGGRQLEARLRALGQAPQGMLRQVGIEAVAQAKVRVPRQTGNLGRTIRIGSISPQHVEVRAGGQLNVGYAAAVELGSRPHIIRPKRRKVLAWGGARTLAGNLRVGAKATNFARVVHHPGTKAQPFLIPGFRDALRIVGLDFLVDRWNQAA
jgi:hypothetical protein